MTAEEVTAFEEAIARGGMAVFPADTVYGLACDPEDPGAMERMYALKGREANKPSATMFFDLDRALAALGPPPRTRAALTRVLPGAVTVVLAQGGLRVPALNGRLAPLRAVGRPVLQTSANRSGGPDPTRLDEVPEELRAAAAVVLDGGQLPGTPSSVVDLRDYERTGEWRILREGAVPADALAQSLSSDAK